jgi:hypothetical protein
MDVRTSRYDAELQMFTDRTRELNLEYLLFLRWLSERGHLEHKPVGPPGGPAVRTSAGDSAPVRRYRA